MVRQDQVTAAPLDGANAPQLATVPSLTFNMTPGAPEFETTGAAIALTVGERSQPSREGVRDSFLQKSTVSLGPERQRVREQPEQKPGGGKTVHGSEATGT